jgi:hypothetical protein
MQYSTHLQNSTGTKEAFLFEIIAPQSMERYNIFL